MMSVKLDLSALDHQIQERKDKEQREANEFNQYADELVRNDHAACAQLRQQRRGERSLQEAVVQYRQTFQQPGGRREFDLNDPEQLKKQDGVQILPGLVGEDVEKSERVKKQRQQLRTWSLLQQRERKHTEQRQQREVNQFNESRMSMNSRALEMQRTEEQSRRAAAIAQQDFNLSLAAEISQRRARERQEDQGNVTVTLDMGRCPSRRDIYMTPEEEHTFTVQRHQQAQEKKVVRMRQREAELRGQHADIEMTRAGLLMDREQARVNKQIRRDLDNTNAQLAQAQAAQKKNLQELYSNLVDERFHQQFGGDRR